MTAFIHKILSWIFPPCPVCGERYGSNPECEECKVLDEWRKKNLFYVEESEK
jgi:hypothetical protein